MPPPSPPPPFVAIAPPPHAVSRSIEPNKKVERVITKMLRFVIDVSHPEIDLAQVFCASNLAWSK
jgi:hypothetical protein